MPFLPAEQHGKLLGMVMLVYVGEIEAGERVVTPFRALATPLADMIRPRHYAEIFQFEEGNDHPTAVAHTMFMDRIDQKVATTLLDYLQASHATMRVAQLRVHGGAMVRVPDEATAFSHCQSRIMVNLAALCTDLEGRIVCQA
jgi:hypothetical protein